MDFPENWCSEHHLACVACPIYYARCEKCGAYERMWWNERVSDAFADVHGGHKERVRIHRIVLPQRTPNERRTALAEMGYVN